MRKNVYQVIGVMSGTSLDGMDLAYITFSYKTSWKFKIISCNTVAYSSVWQQKLQSLVTLSREELEDLDRKYTELIADVITGFIKENNIEQIDAICSHGHTALHQPEIGVTYQIGNLSKLAKLTNNRVVCNFRAQDVALGGQGAPLVPIGDKLLFSNFDFCLNLGGFANISCEIHNQRIAFDICPVNIVLNYYTQKIGLAYDDAGKIAASGKIASTLLEALNNLSFYKVSPPKSLGLEWVRKEVFPLIDSYNLEIKDILKTFTEHIAIQITAELQTIENASVLVTGGGAFNLYLLSRIQALTATKIIVPSEEIINYKEALIFGLLGVLKLREEINCLQSVTGAKYNHSSGEIYLP